MNSLRISILATLSALSLTGVSLAHADDGLRARTALDQASWPRLQGRLQLNTVDTSLSAFGGLHGTSPRLLSASVLGDYYLTGSWLGQHSSGGLRATSGLLMGPVALSLGGNSLGAPSGLSLSRRSLSLWSPGNDGADVNTTIPYIGIGYTGQSVRGTWGFKADFGLVGIGANNDLRLGGSANPAQGLDETLRDMRFKPLIQLGVSYSF